ncbi:MAG: class I SAM-dependent methyltransferase [bacterium]|nr:class I SAM-dependent methyltransferase [bacterium]
MRCIGCGGPSPAPLPFYYEWDARRFVLCRCPRCRLISLDPQPTSAEITGFYSADYFAAGLHGLDRLGTDYESAADTGLAASARFLEREVLAAHPHPRSFFEIGAAMGHLLAAGASLGLACGGIEISPDAAARARAKFGIDLEVGRIEDLDTAPHRQRWDVIYAGDVLEHLPDPAIAVAKAAGMLAPGGVLVVRLPASFDLLSSRLANRLLPVLGRTMKLPDKPYHLHEFTRRSATTFFRRFFDEVDVESHLIPPWKLNRKSGTAAYRVKGILHWANLPVTLLSHRCGDRLTIRAQAPCSAAAVDI